MRAKEFVNEASSGMSLKLGILLILASVLPWIAIPVAVWLAPSVTMKAAWTGGLLIAAEVLFWAGILVAGRDVWSAAKQAGWRRAFPLLWRQLRGPSSEEMKDTYTGSLIKPFKGYK